MNPKVAQLEDLAKRSVVPLNGQSVWVPIKHPIYPAFSKRIMAGLLDLCTLIIIFPAAWLAAWPSTKDADVAIDYTSAWLALAVVAAVLGWIYTVGMHCGEHGATVGEQALGLRVSSTSGRQLTLASATKRYLGTIANLLCLGIPLVTCLANPRLQAWHEAATNTVVVDRRSTHSHIRAYGKRRTKADAGALFLMLALSFLWVHNFAWPWMSSYEERDRVTRAIAAIAPATYQLRTEFLRNAEFPSPEELARDSEHKYGNVTGMRAGRDAKATYVGDGQIELIFNFDPLFHRSILIKAVGAADGSMICVSHNLPPEAVPGWCERNAQPQSTRSHQLPGEPPVTRQPHDFEFGD